jgi:signal transduction histidine kinase
MRRLSLSTKLFAAALPLILAVGALLALTVRDDLRQVADAERGSELGAVWNPLVGALTSIEAELTDLHPTATPAADADAAAAGRQAEMAANRRSTDQSLAALGDQLDQLGSEEAARKHITQARSSLSAARRAVDLVALAPGNLPDIDPIVAYDMALRELVSIGQLLPAEASDAELGRQLLAVVKLSEARVAADAVAANVATWQADPSDPAPLATAQVRFVEVSSVLNEFSAIAPDEWARQYRQSAFSTQLSKYQAQIDSARRAAAGGGAASFDLAGFTAMSDTSLTLQQDITTAIVDRSNELVASTRTSALIRSGITLLAVLGATAIAWLLTRSVTRRVRTVSRRANQVATEQLPVLVEALRDPRGKAVLPELDPINARGSDELAELARAFNSMQSTLVAVAHEQVEVLRRGVSDIFVTMARRNRSLIDRQLAMLDEFEAEVDDPTVLATYYQLDHMATRMRRNSESLLVLANAEPKRRRVKATEIDDVVRAAIGEVEDYRRIDIEALESLQVKGNVVADISHLLAELLDNATSFSPPDSVVRVGGRRAGDSYMLRIVDHGVGVSSERMKELNELLREPPIVGLSVEPTLGMSVVSLLAHRHDVRVTLSQGSPGVTVDVLLPASLFGPIDVPVSGATPPAHPAHARPAAREVPPVEIVPEPAPAAAPELLPSLSGIDFDPSSLRVDGSDITSPIIEPTFEPTF